MEGNIYTKTGQTLKVFGILFGIIFFYYNAFDFSPGYTNEMILVFLGGLFGGIVTFLILFFVGRYLYNLGNKDDIPLKHIKDWPKTLKVIGLISLIITILDIIFLSIVFGPCFISSCDGLGEGLVLLFIILPVLGFAILFWLIPFVYYFIKQR